MASDEILWKDIEALKQKRPQPSAEKRPQAANRSPAGKQAPSPGQAARKLAGKQTIPLQTKPSLTPASTLARYQDSTIEEIRKVVKIVGREVAFARVTPEEKRQLMDMVYSLKRQGVKTSENEIVRIAINFMLNDQRTSGKESVLNRVLAALNAGYNRKLWIGMKRRGGVSFG